MNKIKKKKLEKLSKNPRKKTIKKEENQNSRKLRAKKTITKLRSSRRIVLQEKEKPVDYQFNFTAGLDEKRQVEERKSKEIFKKAKTVKDSQGRKKNEKQLIMEKKRYF